MEILVQLKEELGRLYIAGSKNAVNDPRIKKYVEPLEKLAEKSKVFEALKVGVQGLVDGTEEESFANISKVYALVNSVLTTQIELSYIGNEAIEMAENTNVYENVLSYKTLTSYVSYYYGNIYRNNNSDLAAEAVNVVNRDSRVYRHFDTYLVGQNRFDYSDRLFRDVDNSLVMYFIQTFVPKNTVGCLDRLEYMHKKLIDNEEVFNNKVVPLAKKVVEENHSTVVPEAIKVLGHNLENVEIILGFSKKKGAEYLKSSLIALYTLGAKEFESKFKEIANKDLELSSEVLREILPMCKDVENFEKCVDLVFDKYITKLENEKIAFGDGWTAKGEVNIKRETEILSVLSYDKYHTYFEKLFKNTLVYDEQWEWGYIKYVMYNLIANDIRYNQLIFDSFTEFFANNKNFKEEKMFSTNNEIYYYYLIVIKNLFDSEKVYELTLDFLQVCKNTDIYATFFNKRKYVRLDRMLKNLCRKIEITNGDAVELYNQYFDDDMQYDIQELDPRIFDFLCNETYVFQILLGEGIYVATTRYNAVRIINYMLWNKPELEKQYLEKVYDFTINKIKNNFIQNYGGNMSAYHFENLLVIDNENFARTCFDIVEVLTRDCPNVGDFNKGYSYLARLANGYRVDGYYLKYKYLLEDKKYKKIREYFEQQ